MKFVKKVLKVIKTKRRQRAASVHVRHGFAHTSDPNICAGVGRNAEEVEIQPDDEDCIKTVSSPPYLPIITQLEEYDYVTPFLDATLIPCDLCLTLLVSRTEVPTSAISCGRRPVLSRCLNQ